MGGYGSGRPRERPAAEQSQAWRVADVGDAVRLLLEQERHAPPGSVAEARGSIAWRRGAEVTAELPYRVRRSLGWPGLLLVEAPATDGPRLAGPLYTLTPVESNLGRGQLWYWHCRGCGKRARVLYRSSWGLWECRRCRPVVYASSRESDRRVSAILMAARAGAAMHQAAPDMSPGELAELRASSLALQLRQIDSVALAALAALDRLGLGWRDIPPRWHDGIGRPWSPARRAAYERRG